MITRTKNLNHVRVMQVEETQIFKQHDKNPDWTSCKTEARIVSKFGWGMTGRIEGFGQSTFIANAAKVKKIKKLRPQKKITHLFYVIGS